jgi:hypothetical protein
MADRNEAMQVKGRKAISGHSNVQLVSLSLVLNRDVIFLTSFYGFNCHSVQISPKCCIQFTPRLPGSPRKKKYPRSRQSFFFNEVAAYVWIADEFY